MSKPTHFQLAVSQEDQTATIFLYGYIGEHFSYFGEMDENEITDQSVRKAIQEAKDAGATQLHVRINSVGGSVLHGDNIRNQLQGCGMEVHTYNDGAAYSAAANIFLSANQENRHMARNAKLMIHAPMMGVFGNVVAMRDAADELEKFTQSWVQGLAEDTGMKAEDIQQTYADDGKDHWLTYQDAVDAGFVAAGTSYKTETPPDEDVEQQTYAAVLQRYAERHAAQADAAPEQSVWARLFRMPRRAVHSQTSQHSTTMKKEETTPTTAAQPTTAEVLQQLDPKDIAAFLGKQEGYEVKQTKPKTLAEQIAAAVQAANQPLLDKIDALEGKIQAIDDAPAAAPLQTAGGTPPNAPKTGDAKALAASQERDAKMAADYKNPFLNA